jgi:hypothetical protein
MSSWKKYGGINHFEQLTNINSTNLVVDHLSLRFPYEGIFTICGELIVSGEAYLDNNLSILGNIYNKQNVFISEKLYVKGDVDLSANLTVFGNTYHYNPLYLIGNSGKGSNYFVGDTVGVGDGARDGARAGAVWCGVVWCGVVWCGVVWCGVVERGVV